MKTKFIVQLDNQMQEQIKKDLKNFFKEELNLSDEEMEEQLELAMNSRLVDLEDSIDINSYVINVCTKDIQ